MPTPFFALKLRLFGLFCFWALSFGQSFAAGQTDFKATGFPPSGCVDTILVSVSPVTCNGLRDGAFRVILVEGGQSPYQFSIDNLNFSTNPVFDRLWAGNYILWVRDDTGCLFKNEINIPEPVLLEAKLNTSKTKVKAGEFFTLDVDVEPFGQEIVAVNWRPPTLFDVQNVYVQNISISETTTFAVEIINTGGCVARDHLTVEVEKTDVFIPNIFKPGSNQDSYFTVFAGEGVKIVKSLSVYNRWGTKVFENTNFPANDPFKGWNGKWNGKTAAPGVYLWVAEIEQLDGKIRNEKGDLTLVLDAK